MARFVTGRPIKTEKPSIVVDAGLKPGRYRFRLVVVNQGGRKSKPAFVTVHVVDRTSPPIEPVDPVGPRPPITPVEPLRPIRTVSPDEPDNPSDHSPDLPELDEEA